MAAKDFPASPVAGQVFENWVWNATNESWDSLYNGTPPAMLQVSKYDTAAARTTAIPTPAEGMVTYLDDINQFQGYAGSSWRAFGGLVPVVPSSVTVSSGSGSHDSTTGLVTFSGAGTITVNGVFSNTYKHYRVVVESTGPNDFMFSRLATGGTAYSSNAYSYQLFVFQTGSFGGYYSGNDSSVRIGYSPNTRHHKYLDFSNPYQSETIMMTWVAGYGQTWNSGVLNIGNTTSFDGFQIYTATGTSTGTLKVYGYN